VLRTATTKAELKNWIQFCDEQGIVAAAQVDPNDWYLCTIKNAGVRRDQRGKGYGRLLFRSVAEKALALRTKEGHSRCHVLAADVTMDNVASIRSLHRAGFHQINQFCWGKGEKPADILHFVRVSPRNGKCE